MLANEVRGSFRTQRTPNPAATVTSRNRRPVNYTASDSGARRPVIGVAVLSGFIGTFPAAHAFALILAALCLFFPARIAAAPSSDPTDSQ